MKQCIMLLLALFLYPGLQAQVMGNYGNQQNTYQNINFNAQYRAVPKAANFLGDNQMEITINALSNQKANSYVAVFSVMQVGKTAEETNNLINTRINGMLSELKTLGIPDSNMYIDMVNFLPKYEYDVSKKIFSKKTYTEQPKGFELQKNIHVRYRKPGLLDEIVTAAARQEIYDIVKVDYFVDHPQVVYADLRTAAMVYLNPIKKQYESIGQQLDSAYVITAENAWVAYPINRYESYQAFSSTKLDQDEKSGSVINTADKPISRFYNAVPANAYDIVINPEILEPAVQFSYNLVVHFTLPERKPVTRTEVKKEYLLLTPEGNLKTLKIE
ncbi:MAG: SIMPL domain-containing protein [Lewinellaceae bacterium]|nr:SIMPL domain-containing protein [Lewinellaceae bacterium]